MTDGTDTDLSTRSPALARLMSVQTKLTPTELPQPTDYPLAMNDDSWTCSVTVACTSNDHPPTS